MAIKQYSKKVSAAFFNFMDSGSPIRLEYFMARHTHEFNRVIFDISHAVSHRQNHRNGQQSLYRSRKRPPGEPRFAAD
jgi:hypothetical protein